jgi:hypothetical protein
MTGGHLLGRRFHPQVTPRHHRPIADLHDLLKGLHSFPLLDLGDDGNGCLILFQQAPELGDVLGPAYEGESQIVHFLLDGESCVFPVLLCQRGQAKAHLQQADALVRL